MKKLSETSAEEICNLRNHSTVHSVEGDRELLCVSRLDSERFM